MLPLVGPVEISATIEINGKTGQVTLYVNEPTEAWMREAYEAQTDEERAAAFAPEKLATFVEDWAGFGYGSTGEAAECNYENVLRACRHRVIHSLLISATTQAWARAVEKNSEASSATVTGEAQNSEQSAASGADGCAQPETRH